MCAYELKTGCLAEKTTSAYQTIEDTVVSCYKKIENAFVEAFLEKAEDEQTAEKVEHNNKEEL